MMRCVNALNGLSSFLRTVARYRTWNRLGVNALNGLSSFLPKNIMTEKMAQEMCQRPKRAFFISTIPSETPHKYWLSSLIFAGICLNILKYRDFRPFFGMFTVCSYFRPISSTLHIGIILDINEKLNPFLSVFSHCIAGVFFYDLSIKIFSVALSYKFLPNKKDYI